MNRRAPFAGAALLLAACTLAPHAQAASSRQLDLTFDGSALARQSGTAALHVRTVTHNGGAVTQTSGYGGGSAGRFPAFASSSPQMAILTVVDESGADNLEPGTSAFTFGADFDLDAKSQTSSVDNGNNLIQRGLYTSSMQFKIEVDGGHPHCRVKGSSGALQVNATMTVQPGTWYRATCQRSGKRVTLTVERRSDSKTWTYQGSRATGSLTSASTLPLSVGGKARSATKILTTASDQFNGDIDNAFVDISG